MKQNWNENFQIISKEMQIKHHKQWYERTHKNLTLAQRMKKQQIILLLQRELKQLQTRYNTQPKDKQQ